MESERQIPRKYRICPACGTKNYIEDGEDVKICIKCSNDEMYNTIIQEEGKEKECSHLLRLISARGEIEIKNTATEFSDILGRMRNCGNKYNY